MGLGLGCWLSLFGLLGLLGGWWEWGEGCRLLLGGGGGGRGGGQGEAGELLLEVGAVAGGGAEGEVACGDERVVGFLDFGGEESVVEMFASGRCSGTLIKVGLGAMLHTSSRPWRAGRILPAGRARPASVVRDAQRANGLFVSASRWRLWCGLVRIVV